MARPLALEQAVSSGAEALSVQVAHLAAGLYLAELQVQGRVLRQRWVKE